MSAPSVFERVKTNRVPGSDDVQWCMKTASKMITGIGIPISQRSAPLPKPMIASCCCDRGKCMASSFVPSTPRLPLGIATGEPRLPE